MMRGIRTVRGICAWTSAWLRFVPAAGWIVLLSTAFIGGCSLFHHKPANSPAPAATPSPDNGAAAAPAGPEAKIHISYALHNDYLRSLAVTQYSAAEVVAPAPPGSHEQGTIVRFEGGVEVWQVEVDKSSKIPVIGSAKEYAPSQVKYGEVPTHFIQTMPDAIPAEPLEPDSYYIFEVTRGSGSVNYEAVKVQADGSLEAYAADPRAGTSFLLCCSLSSDFASGSTPNSSDSNNP